MIANPRLKFQSTATAYAIKIPFDFRQKTKGERAQDAPRKKFPASTLHCLTKKNS